MSTLETRTKYVNLVIRKLEYPNNFEDKLREFVTSECTTFAYIKHEHDVNGYGEIEHLHYHLVLVYKEAKRLSTHLFYLTSFFKFPNANGIEISKTTSRTSSIQYLLHKNNPEKTQHKIDEIISSIDKDELQVILDAECDSSVTFEYVLKLVKENPTKMHLIHALGLNTYKNYRSVILDIIEEVRKEANI